MASEMKFVVLFRRAKFNLMFPFICFAGLLNSGSEMANSCFMKTQLMAAAERNLIAIWMVWIMCGEKKNAQKNLDVSTSDA